MYSNKSAAPSEVQVRHGLVHSGARVVWPFARSAFVSKGGSHWGSVSNRARRCGTDAWCRLVGSGSRTFGASFARNCTTRLTRARRPDGPSITGAAPPPSALAAWTCPLTGQLFVEPVLYLAPNDGAAQIYERAALEQQLASLGVTGDDRGRLVPVEAVRFAVAVLLS